MKPKLKITLSRMTALAMALFAVLFVLYAVNHPELSFPWSNTVTYCLYGVYLAAVIILFAAPFQKKK